MSDKERDPSEQALRDQADMIERSCKETPPLRRRIRRLRKAADRIAEITAERDKLAAKVERLQGRICLDNREFCILADMTYEKYGFGWWTAKRDSIRDKKEATDGE